MSLEQEMCTYLNRLNRPFIVCNIEKNKINSNQIFWFKEKVINKRKEKKEKAKVSKAVLQLKLWKNLSNPNFIGHNIIDLDWKHCSPCLHCSENAVWNNIMTAVVKSSLFQKTAQTWDNSWKKTVLLEFESLFIEACAKSYWICRSISIRVILFVHCYETQSMNAWILSVVNLTQRSICIL